MKVLLITAEAGGVASEVEVHSGATRQELFQSLLPDTTVGDSLDAINWRTAQLSD